MAENSKSKRVLKNLPFYSEKIKSFKKSSKKFSNVKFLSELPFFYKKPKELTKNSYQIYYHSHQKGKKRLTKHEILQNTLPLYDSVVISRREHAHKYYAETYDV